MSYVPWRLNGGDVRCEELGLGDREEGEAGAKGLLLLGTRRYQIISISR